MGNRSRASWARSVTVAGLLSLSMAAIAHGQTVTKAWTPPRTPDGQPDLQGIWLSRSATPLERPKALEGRSFLTPEEVAELKARANRLFSNGSGDFAAGDGVFLAALANPDRFKSPTATHGSEDMIDREFDHHTSLVVDPPDGRIPALTPEARRRREAAATAARAPGHPEDFDNALRCIAWGVPRLGGRYGAGDLGYYQILQTSSPWTGARICRRASASGAATRVEGGTGPHSSLRPPIFLPGATSWDLPTGCGWSNA